MGVEWKDCGAVAELIGTKLVINEFVAYEKLGAIIKNRDTCTVPYISVSGHMDGLVYLLMHISFCDPSVYTLYIYIIHCVS